MLPKDRHGKTAQDYRAALIAELDAVPDSRRREAQRSPPRKAIAAPQSLDARLKQCNLVDERYCVAAMTPYLMNRNLPPYIIGVITTVFLVSYRLQRG